MSARLGTLGVAVAALVLSLAAPPGTAAQPAHGTWKIGFLSLVSGRLEQYKAWLAAFRAGLRELGYVEGQNVVIDERYAAGRVDRLSALAAELVRLKVDVRALATRRVTTSALLLRADAVIE